MFELCIYLQKLKQAERLSDSPGSFKLCDFAICTLTAKETAQDHLLHQWEEKSCPVWSSGTELSASTLFSEKAFYSMRSWQTCFWIFTSIFLQPKNTRHMILTWSDLICTSSFNWAGWFSHLARLHAFCKEICFFVTITPGFECEVGFYARGSQVLWHTMQSKRPKKWRSEKNEKPRTRKVICIDVFFCKAIWL